MDEEQNDLWLEEESEENAEEIPWAESILDFADWNQDEDTPVCDEELEEALAEERNAALESELEQDEHPLETEDDIPEDADSAESPISLNTLRQQMDETAVERISLAARTETDFSVVIGEMFEEFQSNDEENLESCIEKQRELGQDLISKAFGIELNNIIGVTGWTEQFVKELSYECGQETSFFSHDEYAGWPAIDLPIQKRPFIKIDEQYYCFDYYSFIDNFYRAIQKTVTRLLPNYRWSAKQQNASETMVANIFEKILPGCRIYQNNFYPQNRSLKNMAENDLMVVYYDVIIVVEIKAGSFVWTAPFTDFDSHIRSYKTLIEKADNQCKRTCDYLSSNDTAILYNEDQSEKAQIHMASIQDIYTMSVTMDNIGEFAAKAEKIGFLNLKCNTISVAVDDLLVYQNYFDSPLQFLHFLKQRRMATRNKTLALNDELDHLGLYIHHNCYALSDNSPKQPTMKSFWGYREDLDTYFGQLYHPELKPQKPIQTLPKYFEQML